MLAYIFWHAPGPAVDRAVYEADLAGFHELLGRQPLEGFHGSLALRIEGAPWVPARPAYEDWYLVEGSAVLDPLNELAVSTAMKAAHDRPAQAARFGAGGLYRLLSGPADRPAAWATWLRKPTDTAYADLYQELTPWTSGPDVSLWRRQMVLGPSPEFCILGSEPARVPAKMQPVQVRRGQIA
jgi:hypothetical protein